MRCACRLKPSIWGSSITVALTGLSSTRLRQVPWGRRRGRARRFLCSAPEPLKTPLTTQETAPEDVAENYPPSSIHTDKSSVHSEAELEEDLDALPVGFIETADQKLSHRWVLTIAMGLSFVLCNMDKVNMSVAVIPMAQDLGWSATSRGIAQSAFFWGYTLTQVPAGWLSTKIGGEKVLLAGVALWSFGTFIAPSAAQLGFMALCISRILVGLGEGLAPSAATSVLSKQVPAAERSRAVATVFGALDLGSAVGLVLCGPMIRLYGWPSVFHLFAILGFIWCLIWPLLRPSLRDAAIWRSKSKQQKEKYYEDKRSRKKVPWDLILKSPPVWAIITAHFCFNWGYYTLLAWLPSFFEMGLDLSIERCSILTFVPYLAMTAMTPLVSFSIPAPQGALFVGISFVGPALCMAACAWLTPQSISAIGTHFSAVSRWQALPLEPGTVPLIVTLLTAAFGLGAWARAGLYCNHQDISPRFSSALLGLTNTAGAVPGILGVWSAGLLFDRTGNWATALFYPIVAAQVLGLLVYTLMANSEPQEWS